MSWFEYIGLIGSVASIIGLIPISIACYTYIKGQILYNKLKNFNPMKLTNAYHKSKASKRQLFRMQNLKLKHHIVKAKHGQLSKADLNEAIMNLIEDMENNEKT